MADPLPQRPCNRQGNLEQPEVVLFLAELCATFCSKFKAALLVCYCIDVKFLVSSARWQIPRRDVTWQRPVEMFILAAFSKCLRLMISSAESCTLTIDPGFSGLQLLDLEAQRFGHGDGERSAFPRLPFGRLAACPSWWVGNLVCLSRSFQTTKSSPIQTIQSPSLTVLTCYPLVN